MIAKFIQWSINGITPTQLDGTLYVLIAVFGAIQTFFSSDDAYKYVNPYILFWIKGASGFALAGVSALKMFRSTAYADQVKKDAAALASKQPENQ